MKTYTQLINEIGIPKMGKAFNQRALKTINPKNIKQLPQNVQKLGRTTELIGKKASQSPSRLTRVANVGNQTLGRVTQAVAKKLP